MYGNEYDAPNIAQENYEAWRDEKRREQEDRYTVAEIKELEAERKDEGELTPEELQARAEALEERAIDHANDMKI